MHSNFLNELPLDLFGIELNKVVEIVASSPAQVGAFISTLVELSRTFAFKEENFYFHALRAYQELHYNYFEWLEDKIDAFIVRYHVPTKHPVKVGFLKKILITQYLYHVHTIQRAWVQLRNKRFMHFRMLPTKLQVMLCTLNHSMKIESSY